MKQLPLIFSVSLLALSCSQLQDSKKEKNTIIKKYAQVVGWSEGKMPTAPEGFRVRKFADGFRNPRWAYLAPNGDVFIAESESDYKDKKDEEESKKNGKASSQNLGKSANRITLLRDRDRDGTPELRTTFLSSLNQPLGMLVLNGYFYVANTDGVYRYPYHKDMKEIKGQGEKILTLPAGGYNNHWTRNLLGSADGKKIYISVGSSSNISENGMSEEIRRANILEINPDGSQERVLASGLRNPVGMSLQPETKKLWTVVNERDGLGDDLVPDYLTSVQDGGFYGWPFAYWGRNPDPRLKGEGKNLVEKTLVPDLDLGSHTASLGLTFMTKNTLGSKFKNGAFIGQHGSWNSSKLVGYKVLFVPFKNGQPSGKAEEFLTGFVKDEPSAQVYGRPVGVTELPSGLLVCDDSSNTLWLVQKQIK